MNQRNGEIDVLKFIFAMLVMCYHFGFNVKHSIFPRGWIGVEFFFLVSGYLMAMKAYELQKNETLNIPLATWNYVIGKVKIFYPYLLVAMSIELIVRRIVIQNNSFEQILSEVYKVIPTLTLMFTVVLKKLVCT